METETRSGVQSDVRAEAHADVWSEWLLHRRHGGDPEYGAAVNTVVESYTKRVLDGAELAPGMILVDVGAGEGLVAFQAIERIGPSLQVILTDVSAPMLQYAEAMALERDVRGQCTFLEGTAEKLDGIADASVDAVITRSVLAYVADKTAALREFYRILKPGGRLSVAEPIFQDEAFFAKSLRLHLEAHVDAHAAQPADRFLTLLHRWKAAQFPDTDECCAASPLVNYSERDLLNFVHAAGFAEIHLQLHIDVMPCPIRSWDVFLDSSPHPWAPSLRDILALHFTPEEQQFFEQIVRPTVELGANTSTDRMVYLNAKKPY